MSFRGRTPTLSNAAQIQLMSAVKKERLSVDDSYTLAERLEEVQSVSVGSRLNEMLV
jgi:hypothetical protein